VTRRRQTTRRQQARGTGRRSPARSARKRGHPKRKRRRVDVGPLLTHTPPVEPVAAGGLTASQHLFVLEYLRNGFNGAAAYRAAYPDCKSEGASRACACRLLLTNANVRAAVSEQLGDSLAKLRLDADEALHLLSRDAQADIRLLYDDRGRPLPVHRWPDEIAHSVKAIQPTAFGIKVVLNDSLKARELLAIAGGKLRQQVDHKHTFDHAGYLAGTETPPEKV
jgi:phage terminase small subunit